SILSLCYLWFQSLVCALSTQIFGTTSRAFSSSTATFSDLSIRPSGTYRLTVSVKMNATLTLSVSVEHFVVASSPAYLMLLGELPTTPALVTMSALGPMFAGDRTGPLVAVLFDSAGDTLLGGNYSTQLTLLRAGQ